MQWTRKHDILLARKIVAQEPIKHKKGSIKSGRIWTQISHGLRTCQEVQFMVNLSQRGVRERFTTLRSKFKEKERVKHKESRISHGKQDELDVLIKEIIDREDLHEENKENENKNESDRVTASKMR